MIVKSNSRGIALILVLVFLVLLSVLALAFFGSVATELQASRNFASGVTTRQLAESATNIVMGQIREATARENGAWASQPGMIRVYRDGSSASSQADAFFKLYSSNNMIVTKSQIGSFDPAADVPATGVTAWYKNPAHFVDLNAPVTVTTTTGNVTTSAKRYPIMDPMTDDPTMRPEGFDVTADAAIPDQPGRMPVRWMYILKDGTPRPCLTREPGR